MAVEVGRGGRAREEELCWWRADMEKGAQNRGEAADPGGEAWVEGGLDPAVAWSRPQVAPPSLAQV